MKGKYRKRVGNQNHNQSIEFVRTCLICPCSIVSNMDGIFSPAQVIALFISLPFEIISVILSTIQLIYVNIKIGKTDVKTSNWSPLPSVSLLIKNARRTHIFLAGTNLSCLGFFFILNYFELSNQCYLILNFGLPVILICTVYSIHLAINAKKQMGSPKEYMMDEDEESQKNDKNNPYNNMKACQRCIIICNSFMFIPFILVLFYLVKTFFGSRK